MIRKNVFPLLVCLSVLALVQQARACECAGSPAPCQAYWQASAVFVGTVAYSSPVIYKLGGHEAQGRLVRFTVDRTFQGLTSRELEVRTGLGGGDCGYPFKLGGQYLVYAYRSEDNQLSTGICSRTRSVSDASEDLTYIRSLTKARRSATIFGEVKRLNRAASFEERLQPVPDVKVVIEGSSNRFEIVTDTKGKYRVPDLPAGTYKVRVELPDGLTIHNPEREVKVFEKGCGEAGFWVETDTRITGRVLDAQGQPAADVLLELVPLAGEGDAFPTYIRSDAEGRYKMLMLQPGRYLLGVRIHGSAGSTYVPFPRTYYPGVSEESRATVITVNEGQRLDLNELILPPRLVQRELNGVVFDVNGRPVSGATVWLKEKEFEDRDMPYRAETDTTGRFSFGVFEGFHYHLNAYLDIGKDERVQAETDVVVSSDPETVKLVLSRRKP